MPTEIHVHIATARCLIPFRKARADHLESEIFVLLPYSTTLPDRSLQRFLTPAAGGAQTAFKPVSHS